MIADGINVIPLGFFEGLGPAGTSLLFLRFHDMEEFCWIAEEFLLDFVSYQQELVGGLADNAYLERNNRIVNVSCCLYKANKSKPSIANFKIEKNLNFFH